MKINQSEKKLQKWVEDFVQRKWYKEFLKIFPLENYPSLLETYPNTLKIVEGYYNNYNIYLLENGDRFCLNLVYDFLNIYYSNYDNIISTLNEKHKGKAFEDRSYILDQLEWFLNNIEKNIVLDKKRNA